MRIELDIGLSKDRIVAHLRDGTVVFDDIAVVAVKPDAHGRQMIAGIGTDRPDRENITVVPLLSDIQFQAALAAAVARFIVHKAWREVRPGWASLLMLIDHVDARIAIDGHERLAAEDKTLFANYLPFDRHITWWINGEKVKY